VRAALVGICALVLTACSGGSDTDKPPSASKKDRLFDTQRDALDKAKGVNDTLQQADQQRKQQEDQQSR
jgi:cell division protein FtsN